MKIKKIILTTFLATASAALVNSASAAAVDVYISGATTYRGSVTEAILDQGTNGILAVGTTNAVYVGSSIYGANEALIHGFLKNGGAEVNIHTYWTGSAAGVYDVATANAISGYITAPSGAFSALATIPGSQGAGVAWGTVAGTNPAVVTGGVLTTYTQAAHYPDAILSDSLASSVANELNTAPPAGTLNVLVTNAGLLSCGSISRNPSSNAATNNTVGIAPMLWVVGNSTVPATFSNISQQAAKSLCGGPTSAELFSGLNADKNNYVCLIGRNEDSGTRIGALSESAFGVTSTSLKQFLPTFTGTPASQSQSPGFPGSGNPAIPEGGTSATVATLGLWPTDWTLNTDANIDWIHAGHSGFTGGGDVAKCLSAVNPVNNLSFAVSGTFGDYPNNSSTMDPNVAGGPSGFNGAVSSVWLVGYLGVADAISGGTLTPSVVNGSGSLSSNAGVSNGTVLSYNGVQYSGIASVEHGSYTYWVLEHMYYNPNNADTNSATNVQKETVDDVANALYVTYAPTNSSGVTDHSGATTNVAGILYTDMDFTRSGEGVVPTTK